MATSPTHIEVLDEGIGEFLAPDPDGYREWVRDHKSRALVSKLMTEQEAVSRFVEDGEWPGGLELHLGHHGAGERSVYH